MAQPARRSRPRAEAPPVDPAVVTRAYQRERARRRARVERTRARRQANLRFWVAFLLLLAAAVVLCLTIWREIVDLFGPLSPFA